MNNSPRLSVRMDSETINTISEYCEAHGLSKSEALRIAVERLAKSKPTKPERERARYPMGRPTDAD